jgi:hypothetical protein
MYKKENIPTRKSSIIAIIWKLMINPLDLTVPIFRHPLVDPVCIV